MEATITKIELKKLLNKFYIRIELIDEFNHKHNIDNPLFSNNINFRKIIFGLMLACNNFDLMRLATNNPIPKKVQGYYTNRLEILENESGEKLFYDESLNSYICTPNHPKIELLDTLIKYKLNNFEKNSGEILSIESRSGVFMLLLMYTTGGATYFTTNQIYYGFGKPLNIGNEENIKYTKDSARIFTSFITSLMQFYRTNDLLKLGGQYDELPKVDITINRLNKITSITNHVTQKGFMLNQDYTIINNTEEMKKILKK